jgi:hypothetical protein
MANQNTDDTDWTDDHGFSKYISQIRVIRVLYTELNVRAFALNSLCQEPTQLRSDHIHRNPFQYSCSFVF